MTRVRTRAKRVRAVMGRASVMLVLQASLDLEYILDEVRDLVLQEAIYFQSTTPPSLSRWERWGHSKVSAYNSIHDGQPGRASLISFSMPL
jgi:hypothetical protein